MSTSGPSAIVVGAGAFGSSTALALARRGWSVTVVDRHGPANARGSSGDRTRLLRLGHSDFTDDEAAWYSRSAARGIAGWRQIEEAAGVPLLVPTGLVWLDGEADGPVARAGRRLQALDLPATLEAPAAAAARYPSLEVADVEATLWEPAACVIRAESAVRAAWALARAAGAELVLDEARPDGPGAVRLAGGGRLEADRVVWACGAWLGGLLGEEAPVRPAWQEVLHWDVPAAWRDVPAFFDEPAEVYGFPDVDGLGLKAVTHHPGPAFDLDRTPRVPTPAGTAALAGWIARRFPALRDLPLLWARVMPYEMTPDGHFLLGPSPEDERRWVLGGGSGHGFKHAPALGELLATCLEGAATPEPFHATGPRPDQEPAWT